MQALLASRLYLQVATRTHSVSSWALTLTVWGGQPHPQQGRLWDPSQSARQGELEHGAQAEPGFLPTHAILLISIAL